jgi:hypothetical protein
MASGPVAVLLVVGGDSRGVETTASALNRRFGSDYRILTAGSEANRLAELTVLACGGEQVALVAADLHLPDGDGVEFLERAAVCTTGSHGCCCRTRTTITPACRSVSCPHCSAPPHSAGSTAGW